jgi:hypothetical protein
VSLGTAILLGQIHRALASQIAGANFADDVIEGEMVAVAVQLQGQPIGRRQRQCQIRQIKQIGEVLSLQFDVGVDAAEIERFGDYSAERGAGGAGIDHGLEVVGMIQLDVQQGVALEAEFEWFLVERALTAQLKWLGSLTRAIFRGAHYARKREFLDGIVNIQVAALECEVMQRRKPRRLLPRRMGLAGIAKIPIGPAVRITPQ